MEPLSPVGPDELSTLAMENELLRYEVAHLRARLAAAETTATPADETPARRRAGGADADRSARDDLVWLLRRLDGSLAGPLLRRRSGFRQLRERYLGESSTGEQP